MLQHNDLPDSQGGTDDAITRLWPFVPRDREGGEECFYHNAGTCPDCGAGMVRLGRCMSCPSCGLESCAG